MKVYVVCSGMDDRGTVDAVFSTREEAERYVRNFPGDDDIYEMELDPDHSDKAESGLFPFHIDVERGDVGTCRGWMRRDAEMASEGWCKFFHDSQGNAYATLYRWAKDEADARSQGHEWLGGYLFENEWPEPVEPRKPETHYIPVFNPDGTVGALKVTI